MVLEGEDAHAVEGDDDAGGGFLADVSQLHVAVEGDAAVVAQVVEQHLLALAVADGLGGAGLLDGRLVTHDALVQTAGEHGHHADKQYRIPRRQHPTPLIRISL